MGPLNYLIEMIKKIDRSFNTDSEWVYSPEGWVAKEKLAARANGWYDKSVIETQRSRWPRIVQSLQGTGPLTTAYTCCSPETTRDSRALKAHDVIMSYAYVLALARKNNDSVSILDWGGGVGLYHLLANVLFPELKVDYYSYDTPILCKLGREFWPQDVFYDDAAAALGRKYDLVISSSSLQYFEHWQETLAQMTKAALRYLYVSRLPIVRNADSFVAIHRVNRVKSFGYDTEFVEWMISRDELLECARAAGMRLVREFLDVNRIYVHKAPEGIIEERGFLFTPNDI